MRLGQRSSRVKRGKRPPWGKRPTPCSRLTTHFWTPVSWSGYQHHLSEVFGNSISVENWQGRRQHVFFLFHHFWCKYRVCYWWLGEVSYCAVSILWLGIVTMRTGECLAPQFKHSNIVVDEWVSMFFNMASGVKGLHCCGARRLLAGVWWWYSGGIVMV